MGRLRLLTRLRACPFSPLRPQLDANRHIEFRIILLHVLRPVFLTKLLDHRFHSFVIGDGSSLEPCFCAPCINSNGWVLQHVSVPLRVRTLHGQEVQLFVFQHEPDRNRDCLPRLPADHAELDLAVAGEAFFEVVLWVWHDTLLSAPRVVEPSNSRRSSRVWLPDLPTR